VASVGNPYHNPYHNPSVAVFPDVYICWHQTKLTREQKKSKYKQKQVLMEGMREVIMHGVDAYEDMRMLYV